MSSRLSQVSGNTPRTNAVLQNGIDHGLHVGAQFFISRGSEVLANDALGLARPGVPLRADTLMIWMSACKPVTAVAIAQLWERGLLDPDDRVVRHISEFGQNGKDTITIRHLLTHTAGFRAIAGEWE